MDRIAISLLIVLLTSNGNAAAQTKVCPVTIALGYSCVADDDVLVRDLSGKNNICRIRKDTDIKLGDWTAKKWLILFTDGTYGFVNADHIDCPKNF